jgi:hypothetical protein
MRPLKSGRLDAGGAVPVDSPEFWRRVERTDVSSDPDVATAQVVRRMCDLAATAATDSVLRAYAVQAVRQFRGGPLWAAAGVDPFAPGAGDTQRLSALAESVWWWAKVYLRFSHHSHMIWDRLRERDQWQLLIAPDVLVRMWPMRGDCAVYSTLIPSMLSVLGVPWELETVAADGDQPTVYSHVFVRAILPDGSRLPLDASHGDYPGWQVPARDVYRSQVWDSSGRPVAKRGQFKGLHYYALRRGRGLGRVRGLGDTDLWSVWGLDPAVAAGTDMVAVPASSLPVGSSSSPSSGTNWGGVFSGLLNQWTQIGGRVLAPTVSYSRGPNGQLVYTAPAGSAASVVPGVFGSGSTPSLLWVGGGIALLVLVAAVAGKGGR